MLKWIAIAAGTVALWGLGRLAWGDDEKKEETTKKPLGKPCGANSECLSGHCVDGKCWEYPPEPVTIEPDVKEYPPTEAACKAAIEDLTPAQFGLVQKALKEAVDKEDPSILSALAADFEKAASEDSVMEDTYMQMASCLKHYAKKMTS